MINRAVPASELDGFVDTLARRIARLTPEVARAATLPVDAALELPIGEGLAVEQMHFTSLFTPETAERSVELLKRGLQTREGERDLEGLLDQTR